MKHSYKHLLVSVERDGLAIVTMNRPEVMNAFNTGMASEMVEFFGPHQTGQAIRCIVLTGAGERAFCAGADLKERNNMTNEEWSAQHLVFERLFEIILGCPIPVIAAVNGLAYGGGGELVATCDFAYSARSARFAQREVALAIFPGGGGTQLMPRLMGPARANELILTGQPIDANTALAWGLVNRVFDDGVVLDEAIKIGRAICANGPLAVRQAKKAMQFGMNTDLHTGLIFERESYHRLLTSKDRTEGISAFNEKRKPVFVGH